MFHTRESTKTVRRKGTHNMKKDTKLIVLLAVLVVFVGAYKLVGYMNNKAEADKKTALFDLKAEDITELDWTYSGAEFSIKNDSGTWHWSEDDKFPIEQETAKDMASKFAGVSYSQEISEENKSEYGFGNDNAVISAKDKDGKEYKLTIGGSIAISGEDYAEVDGRNAVYAIDANLSLAFNKSIDNLLAKEPIEQVDNYDKINITYGDKSLDLTKDENGKWKCGDAELDAAKVTSLANSFFGLLWQDCDSYNADSAKKSERGFDNPTATVSISSDKDELKILFGKEEGDCFYAKLDGSNMIYTVSNDIKSKLDTTADSLKPDETDEGSTEQTDGE